jgi:hypothetical protein
MAALEAAIQSFLPTVVQRDNWMAGSSPRLSGS